LLIDARKKCAQKRIARPQGRARIETRLGAEAAKRGAASPGLKAGRGLKRELGEQMGSAHKHRPASRPGAD